MDPLVLADAFPEPWIDAARAGVSFAAEAHFDGVIAFTSWARDDVLHLLPPGIRIGHNVSASPDRHPVVFVFGMQTQCTLLLGGFPVPTGVQYPELTVAVPFVAHAGGRHLHVFIPRIYSGDAWATWIGDARFGYGKQMADMAWLGHTFTVSAPGGPLLAHATFGSDAPWQMASSWDAAGFAAGRAVFRLPMLGHRSDGTDVCSYFEWDFADATVRPASAAVSIVAPLGPGLDPRSCHGVESGTFEVRNMRWRVSWPTPCRF